MDLATFVNHPLSILGRGHDNIHDDVIIYVNMDSSEYHE